MPPESAESLLTFKLIVFVALYAFVPMTALAYYVSRRKRRVIEVDRVLSLLEVDPAYRKAFEPDNLGAYTWAVAYMSLVTMVGLTLLLFSNQIGLAGGEFPTTKLGEVDFPQTGSRIVMTMAFLGAYLSGLQHIFRRYAATDLAPTLYYGSSVGMIFAATISLVIYNAYSALSGGGGGDADQGITAMIWPALAFLIGLFPQQGLSWLTERAQMLSPAREAYVRPAPLEMIEGIEGHDALRLQELGIDTCYDLASADFVPLLLKTPYSARQLVDWILQAKLCVYFGESVKDLRRLGVRTVVDLQAMTAAEIETLPHDTSVTDTVLLRAAQSVRNSPEIARLCEIGRLLGVFSDLDNRRAAAAAVSGNAEGAAPDR